MFNYKCAVRYHLYHTMSCFETYLTCESYLYIPLSTIRVDCAVLSINV